MYVRYVSPGFLESQADEWEGEPGGWGGRGARLSFAVMGLFGGLRQG